tara:strand:- start:3424 stop:3729 length:306 start_codon:yes stop_codon:yes gene_type:complete
MAAWKSSDGGSITPLGASTATVSATGTVVSGASNVRGIYMRTLGYKVTGASSFELRAGGILLKYVYGQSLSESPEIFIPAGLALTVVIVGTVELGFTYDLA